MEFEKIVWAVANERIIDWETASYLRKDAINKFIKHSKWDWKKWKKEYGYKCIKFKMTATALNCMDFPKSNQSPFKK